MLRILYQFLIVAPGFTIQALRMPGWVACALIAIGLAGCGNSQRRTATEQLVLSDAVDRAVRNIDFSPLGGATCWLDTSNIASPKSAGFVSAGYIKSSLRNQMVAAGCRLVESRDDAQVVVEARVGVLGSDHHEITYGFPSNSMVTQATSLVPTAPAVPPLPEIAFAEKDDQTGAAKLAVFAYDAGSGGAIWQSGVVTAQSTGRDTWVLGVGPFQSGTIYEKPRFAGTRVRLPLMGSSDLPESRQMIQLDEPFEFRPPQIADIQDDDSPIEQVAGEEDASE